MPKILFIALHRPDRSPSQRFRYEQYIDFLTKNNWDCKVSYLIPEKWDKPFYAKGHYIIKFMVLIFSFYKRIGDILNANKYDVIYIQREALMIGSVFFERRFTRSKAKVIFDFDDAIWLPNVSDGNRKLEWLKSPEKTSKIIDMVDLVFAGNHYLSDYARQYNKNVKIVPTTIDTNRHISRKDMKDSSRICIGWTGSTTTIQHFENALPALERIRKKYNDLVYFVVIGDENYQNQNLAIQGIAWSVAKEIEDLQLFDIGIMPLPDTEWAKGKCALKGLQYMALGIPSVMSPVGMNKELIKDGENGFLATDEEDWVLKLSHLIEDKLLRETIGQKARQTIVKEYSVLSQQKNYLNYLNELIEPS